MSSKDTRQPIAMEHCRIVLCNDTDIYYYTLYYFSRYMYLSLGPRPSMLGLSIVSSPYYNIQWQKVIWYLSFTCLYSVMAKSNFQLYFTWAWLHDN